MNVTGKPADCQHPPMKQPTEPAPRPSVPPRYDAAETQVHTILDSLTATIDGELRPNGYAGRHRDPQDRIAVAGQRQWELITEAAKPAGEPHRLRVQVGVGAFIAFAAAVTVVVLAVFW
jgi:hypothetical protein